MKVFELEKILDNKLKKDLAETWDNVGLLVGKPFEEVSSIYLTLELTKESLKEAIDCGANFIITHHPLIFSGLKKIIEGENDIVMKLIENKISLYSAHTNFDKIKFGLNDYFVSLLSDKVIYYPEDEAEYIRIFEVKKQSIKDFIKTLKSKFDTDNIRFIGDLDLEISKVGIVTGAGSEFVEEANKKGAEVFITGDIKYHEAMGFLEKNINVIDLGHFDSEKIFARAMKNFIDKNIKELLDLKIFVSNYEKNPFKFL